MEIGFKRKFNSRKEYFIVREVLKDSGIKMFWSWKNGVCPFCKHELINDTEHIFHTIEILGVEGIKDEELTTQDIIILGMATDKKVMFLTIEKFDEVFSLSEKFRHLASHANGG